MEQHIGETGEDGDDNSNNDVMVEKGGTSTENMLMRKGSDETYPHHSDDTVHDDQADQIQETVDSGKVITNLICIVIIYTFAQQYLLITYHSSAFRCCSRSRRCHRGC